MSDAQIFQIFSIIYLSIGAGMLVNRQFYKKVFAGFVENSGLLFISGIMASVVGLLLISFHNTWTCSASTILTVIGWLALTKGVLTIVLPNVIISITQAMTKNDNVIIIESLVVIAIGVLFLYLGWCPMACISGQV